MSKLTVIDFFCGAGGFSEGFRQQGYKIVEGFDYWKPAIETFNHNFKTKSQVKDVLDFGKYVLEINNLPETDIIIGSPPCVSFSNSNKSGKADKSLGVKLTECFFRIIAVKKHQPNSMLKGWFMENVVNSKNYLKECYTFNDLGLEYWAYAHNILPDNVAINLKNNTAIINSADYGSYQARKRLFAGEIVSKNKLIIPQVTHFSEKKGGQKKWNTLGELINEIPSPNIKESNQIIQDPIYKEIKISLDRLTDQFYDSGLYKSEWRQSRELKLNHYCMGKMSFPENLDKPSRTITATKSGTSRESIVYKSEYVRKGNGEYRTPTIREAASIMGFPYTYQFVGSINNKWRLVGNAVCPSVSRAFAAQLKKEIGKNIKRKLILVKSPNLLNVENLNTFKEKEFNQQPKRTKKSRFRRHPVKDGNLTVTLSNYNIETNSKSEGKWLTSIQYGTGKGFKSQEIKDEFYQIIEPIILQEKPGFQFLQIINNGFSDKIGSSKELQKYYELQISDNIISEPTELVEEIAHILNEIEFENKELEQNGTVIFKHKTKIPLKQLFALYAINKISSTANRKQL